MRIFKTLNFQRDNNPSIYMQIFGAPNWTHLIKSKPLESPEGTNPNRKKNNLPNQRKISLGQRKVNVQDIKKVFADDLTWK